MMEITDSILLEMKLTLSKTSFDTLFDSDDYTNVGFIEAEGTPLTGDFSIGGKNYVLISYTNEPRPYRFFIGFGEFSMEGIPAEFYEIGKVWKEDELVSYARLEGKLD